MEDLDYLPAAQMLGGDGVGDDEKAADVNVGHLEIQEDKHPENRLVEEHPS